MVFYPKSFFVLTKLSQHLRGCVSIASEGEKEKKQKRKKDAVYVVHVQKKCGYICRETLMTQDWRDGTNLPVLDQVEELE